MITSTLKKCNRCEEEKSVSNFGKHGKYIRSICKKCCCEVTKIWAINNPDKAKEKQKKWYANNTNKAKELTRNWQKNNPDRVKEQEKKRREIHPERNIKWRKNNLELARNLDKERYKNNPEIKAKKSLANLKKKYGLEIPVEISDLKKLQLKLVWLIKEKSAQQSQSV